MSKRMEPSAVRDRLPEQMQAAVLYGREEIRVEAVEMPHAREGEVILRVDAALTCGTDRKVFRRGYHAKMIQPPALFGHEVAGTIVESRAAVVGFALGDAVVALNSAPCGSCYFCQREQENLCEDLLFHNGAYAEYMRVPARIVARNMLRIPTGMTMAHAAMTEPLACALHAWEDSGARAGDTVVVIGAGPLGLMAMQLAVLAGCRLIAVVKHDSQAELVRELGAAEVVQTGDGVDAVQAVRDCTPAQRGVDLAIEAVATPETWEQAVAMTRNGGTVNFFGGPAAGTVVRLDTNRLHYGDLTLKATFHHRPEVCRRALAVLADGRFRAEMLLCGEAGLADLQQIFHDWKGLKTVILPGGPEGRIKA